MKQNKGEATITRGENEMGATPTKSVTNCTQRIVRQTKEEEKMHKHTGGNP